MPTKLKVPCKYPRCPKMVEASACFCDEHKKYKRNTKENRDDFRPEAQTNKGFYHSYEWVKYRAAILKNRGVCHCGEPATMVDHIVPINEGGGKFDPFNVQPMCDSCHAKKRQAESMRARDRRYQTPDPLIPLWNRLMKKHSEG